jgi:hypothetical protein
VEQFPCLQLGGVSLWIGLGRSSEDEKSALRSDGAQIVRSNDRKSALGLAAESLHPSYDKVPDETERCSISRPGRAHSFARYDRVADGFNHRQGDE